MLYKWNLIGFENMMGMVCVICGYMLMVYENVLLWYECDIFYLLVECIIFFDVIIVLNYMLNCFSNIVKNLMVFLENMKCNMDCILGLIYFQCVLFVLIDMGLFCEEVYDMVQLKVMEVWEK